MNRLNQNNEDTFVCSAIIKNQQVDFYLDDYGQCYYFEFINKDGELEEVGCGTYNTAFYDEAIGYFDPKGWYYSIGQEDSWKEMMKARQERGLESIDYDDYCIYNIEKFYKDLEED